MINNQQNIEIGGVCCSIGFKNQFFEKEFDLVLSDYKRWGFGSQRKPEISISVKEGFYQSTQQP